MNKTRRADRSHTRISQKVAREFQAYMEDDLPQGEPIVKTCRRLLLQRLRAYFSRPPPSTYVPASEAAIAKEVFARDIYRFRPTCCLKSGRCFLKPGDTLLDIGAHIGLTALAASSVAARVVAVEPNPRCFAIMKRNLTGRSAGCEFVLEQMAVSGSPGKLDFWLHKGRGKGRKGKRRDRLFFGGLYKRRPVQSTPIVVDAQRLDWFISRHNPDVIKLDAEGAEIEIGRCRADAWGRVRAIVAEWDWTHHDLSAWGATKAALQRSGFDVKHPKLPEALPVRAKNTGMIIVATRHL